MSSLPLSHENPVAEHIYGPLSIQYRLHPETGLPELQIIPSARTADQTARRQQAPIHPTQALEDAKWNWHGADTYGDCLVQLHVRGDEFSNGFLNGQSMRHSKSTHDLTLLDQAEETTETGRVIRTRLQSPHGLVLTHELSWVTGTPGLVCTTSVTNIGQEGVVLEHLSSFALNGVSPFAEDDQKGRLHLHRLRSTWSLEARHVRESFEDLHLERTWAGYGHVNLRFGQTGSQPVRGYFPYAAVEDCEAGILWGAQLVWHGSWQLEVHRREDPVTLAGSHADFDFGQWSKTLMPGETLTAPAAILSSVEGNIDDMSYAMLQTRKPMEHPEPEGEHSLPMIFNEWCSTWGNPTLQSVRDTAEALADTPTGIFVIDDGWAKRPGDDFQTNGDWVVDEDKFPGGIAKASAALREKGLTPGIWFEFEVCNRGNPAYELTDHQLHRHGKVLSVGNRHFWDFRDPWTHNYLAEKVIGLLRDQGFGYIKVDYNDTIGIGCDVEADPNAGLGEGLRQHLLQVREFFLRLRREIPELRIESCSSGGHRLEPGMIDLATMSSFSDAHECVEIPIVGANVLRMLPARKNQIWVVLRPDDSVQRLEYGFAATFLGRMAVSGDLEALNPGQRDVMTRAQAFYVAAHDLIRDGMPRLHQEELGDSYRYPEGRQAVTFHDPASGRMLVVVHSFEKAPEEDLSLDLPEGNWTIAETFGQQVPSIKEKSLSVPVMTAFSGMAVLLSAV